MRIFKVMSNTSAEGGGCNCVDGGGGGGGGNGCDDGLEFFESQFHPF